MNLKQYHRYRMDFTSKAASISALCMGVSLFLLSVYYFLLRDLSSIKSAEAIFGLVIPMLVSVAFIVLIRFVKWNAPGLFAIIGAVVCLTLMITAFSSGSLLRGILGGVWYIFCGIILIAVAGGYFPGTMPACVMFSIALIVRLLAFDLRLRGVSNWVHELAILSMIFAWICLPHCFQSAKPRK